ncbi:MAG: T9SS type A sorting domain-containing protein [bacterium]
MTQLVLTLSALCLIWRSVEAQFVVGGDARVNPDDFKITTFASGLNYPVGMARLADGSILVAVSNGAAFFNSSSGSLIRLVDSDDDGVAENKMILVNDVPGGGLTALRTIGSLVFATGQGKPIAIYRLQDNPTVELSALGTISIDYSGNWLHPHSALAVRSTPGEHGSYDLFFQLGSSDNFAHTIRTLPLNSTIGLAGTLNGDALYMVRLTDNGVEIMGFGLMQIATGLRNAAGMAFHPATGDLYLEDNGIDGLVNINEPHSTDELNMIPADKIGGEIEDFGFPDNYVAYRSSEFVGGEGIPPLFAFQPVHDPLTGDESEGANDIAFAPPGFPANLNDGVFVGFHGRFSLGGLANEENPLVYVDLKSSKYFHFIGNDQPGVGHLDGLLATDSSLFVADISPGGGFNNAAGNSGIIYQIRRKAGTTAVKEHLSTASPTVFNLSEAWPNPFNPNTTIAYQLPVARDVVLTIYNVRGQKVTTLINQRQNAGFYTTRWNGINDSGELVSSGIYLYRLKSGDFVQTKRMVLLK